MECNYTDIITKIVNDILITGKQISLKLFEGLDKDTALNIFYFLSKYRSVIHLDNDLLDNVRQIVVNKYENVELYILNPSINDLLQNNFYKLYVLNELYLVPLWHNELYFDAPDGSEIIVLCQPKLPDKISIDENNNICCELIIKIDDNLLQLIKYNNFVSIEVGEKWFSIPLNKLFLKEEQMFRFKGQGISQIIEKDIYNVSCKSDIIAKIILN